MSSSSVMPRMFTEIPLCGITALDFLTTRNLERCDLPRTITSISGSPYEFTEGISECVNGPGGLISYEWTYNTSKNNPFCSKGWEVGSNRTIQFSGTYTAEGYNRLAVYGSSRSPLVLYQVVEGFVTYNPASYTTRKGNVSSDRRLYDIMTATRINFPSINGDLTSYEEFWSVNTLKWYGSTMPRTMTMDCHFNASKSFA
ncbi:glycosyl hydrolases family 11-domain-containing protein [Panaeolus papilionaceus]|nr:glycosyl hydrolases family 11-domain-containing protein [Panaeolus papilionaceus]